MAATRKERLAVALISLIFTYAFSYEYFPPAKQVHLWSDIAGYHYPLQAYAFGALKAHRIPLWDSAIYGGISFVGNIQAALFYPPTWLMFAAAWGFERIPFKALEIFAFLHIWLAFWLGYLWLRTRNARLPAIFGGAVFAFSGYVAYQILHLGVICAAAWLPLGLWGIDEAVDRRDWRPLWKVAAASALAFLAGYPAAWLVNAVIWGVYALASRAHWRAALGVGAAIAASMLLAMAQLLPVLESRSLMTLEPKYGPGAWGRGLLLAYFVPNWFDFNPGHPTDYEPGSLYFYLGLPALFAIVWALWNHKLRPFLQPAVALAFALLLANPPDILIRAVERIRLLDYTLQPFNFYTGAAAMAACITAIGLNEFLKAGQADTRPLAAWVAPAMAAALAGWSIAELRLWVARHGVLPHHIQSIVLTACALALFSAGFWAYRATAGRRRLLLSGMLLLLVGVDYRIYSSGRWFNAIEGDLDEEHDDHGMRGMERLAYETLIANRNYRIVCDEAGAPYSTDLRFWGLASPQGFDPFLPKQYHDRIERWVKFRTNRLFFVDVKNDEMLRALGVRYVITHEGVSNEPYLARSPKFRRIGHEDFFYRVYEYLDARPSYYWADDPSGTAWPVAWKPERREFMLESEHGGRFALVEQFAPGWRATVDGRPVAIERWDGAFQAIQAPAGQHRVRFLFRPVSVEIGAAISLISLAALLQVAASDRKARARGR